jgi:hypothetical protein
MIFWLFCCPEEKYQPLSRLIALAGIFFVLAAGDAADQ